MTEYNEMLARATQAIREDRPDDLELALIFPAADSEGNISSIGFNFAGHNGTGFLHMAAWLGSEKCAALLLDNGADPSSADTTGKTPLHLASWRNIARMAKLLLDNGADPNARDSTGMTPLHLAVMGDGVRAGDVLLKGGAHVDPRDNYGSAPLHWAALKGRVVMAEFLMTHGADKTLTNDAGNTALDVAKRQEADEIIALLSGMEKPPSPPAFKNPKGSGPR